MAAALDILTTTFSRRSSIQSAESAESIKPLKQRNRPRALTLPLESPQRVGLMRTKQQTIDQASSILFRLPPEVRAQVYRLVLGGKCVAQDISGNRIGDRSDPWPPYERPGGERRGLRSWGWQPTRQTHFLSLLLTCRQIYSESINILYSSNLFYFRNPFTNWSVSSWQVLPQRLEQVRVLVLDETVGDPSIMFSKRKQWNRMWRIIAKMTRLKVLYLNVDTLYSKVWMYNADLEKRLLTPLAAITQPSDICVILRWLKPAGLDENEYPAHVRQHIWRQDDYRLPDEFYAAHGAADMRYWIIKILTLLQDGSLAGGRESLLTISRPYDLKKGLVMILP